MAFECDPETADAVVEAVEARAVVNVVVITGVVLVIAFVSAVVLKSPWMVPMPLWLWLISSRKLLKAMDRS